MSTIFSNLIGAFSGLSARDLIAQGIGIVACIILILSYQQRSNRHLYIWQSIGSVGFFINYLMLGAINGAMMNLLSIVRMFILLKGDKWKKTWVFWLIQAAFVAATLVTVFWIDADSPTRYFSFIVMAAQLIGTWGLWLGDGGKYRLVQLFGVSPLWLVYNVLVFTVGGIVCECFNIVSVIISLVRFRKSGFQK